MEILLDSGSSMLLLESDILSQTDDIVRLDASRLIRLAMASRDQLHIVAHVRMLVVLGELKPLHEFEVVESFVTPVILNVDSLQENGLVLDFAQRQQSPAKYPAMLEVEHKIEARARALTA